MQHLETVYDSHDYELASCSQIFPEDAKHVISICKCKIQLMSTFRLIALKKRCTFSNHVHISHSTLNETSKDDCPHDISRNISRTFFLLVVHPATGSEFFLQQLHKICVRFGSGDPQSCFLASSYTQVYSHSLCAVLESVGWSGAVTTVHSFATCLG